MYNTFYHRDTKISVDWLCQDHAHLPPLSIVYYGVENVIFMELMFLFLWENKWARVSKEYSRFQRGYEANLELYKYGGYIH